MNLNLSVEAALKSRYLYKWAVNSLTYLGVVMPTNDRDILKFNHD